VVYSLPKEDPIRSAAETVAEGLNLQIVEVTVSRHKGTTQAQIALYAPDGVDVEKCTTFHRALLPRLELLLPGQDLYVEVASPGIDRTLKDGREFCIFQGRGVRCYRIDTSDWSAGSIASADEVSVVLKTRNGEERIPYELIAKAKLDYSQEVER